MEQLALLFRFKVWAPLRSARHPSFYTSHSQFGEDMVVRQLLENVQSGFYVEVGAHHPVYYSNTYHFYRRRWRGINIDAAPGSMAPFRCLRPRDINLELCIGPRDGDEVTFYIFDPAAFSSFDEAVATQVQRTGAARLRGTTSVRTVTLMSCLERHVPPAVRIDYLSIDIEGADHAVLASLDFNRHAPRVISFEDPAATVSDLNGSPSVALLVSHGYEIVGKCGPSVIARHAREN